MIERAKRNTHAQRTMTPGRRQKSKDVKYDALTDRGVTVAARTHRAERPGRAAERSASVQLNQTQRVKHNQTRAMRAKLKTNTTSDERFTQTERRQNASYSSYVH